jgi:thioredoxin 1
MKPVTRILIIALVCILAGVAILAGSNSETANEVVTPADQNLPRLLDLGSHYCTPCQLMVPELDALSEEYAGVVDVEFIDVNENQNAAESYGIKLIPTQIFIDEDGNELFRHEGFMSREEMAAKLAELGYYPLPPQN